MTIKYIQQKRRDEFEKEFSPEKIWVVPSLGNIETINDIKNFQDEAIRKSVEEVMEKMIKELKCESCKKSFDFHCPCQRQIRQMIYKLSELGIKIKE
jgi:hypothetical protein